MKIKFSIFVLALIIFIPLPYVVNRIKTESAKRTIQFIVDYHEWEECAIKSKIPVDKIYEELRKISVSYILTELDLSLIMTIADNNFKPAIRLMPTENLLNTLKNIKLPKNTLIIFDREVSTFGINHKEITRLIEKNRWQIGSIEFSSSVIVNEIYHTAPNNIISIHEITQKLLNELSLKNVSKRLIRAIKERNMESLMIHTLPQQTIEPFYDNLKYLMTIKEDLTKNGINIGEYESHKLDSSISYASRITRKLISLLLALLVPTIVVLYVSRKPNTSTTTKILLDFLLVSFLSFICGIWISWLLYDRAFLLKIDQFQGTKLALIAPSLVLIYYSVKREFKIIKNISKQPVTISTALFISFAICCIFLLFFLVILRSGNVAISTLPGEKQTRELLENILIIRPRFKEMAGHTLFICGLLFITLKKDTLRIFGILLIAIGTIGQTSIINTFCHIHTPLLTSIIRTFHGMWIAIILGLIIVQLCKKYKLVNAH